MEKVEEKVELKLLSMLIFDLDGVITSEQKYWNTARLTVWEIICNQNYLDISQYFGQECQSSRVLNNISQEVISNNFIYELKSRAINSNWDLTFFVVSLHLVSILSKLKQIQGENSYHNILNDEKLTLNQKFQNLALLLKQNKFNEYNNEISNNIIQQFWQETKSLTGGAVLNHINSFIETKLGKNYPCFDAKGELWKICYDNFQAWYEGKKGYKLPDDDTVLDVNQIKSLLKTLKNTRKYTLAIATGRPRNETIEPLKKLGLLEYFDKQRIVTYDEVLTAETLLSNLGKKIKLGKPHPFVLFKAIYPQMEAQKLCEEEFTITNEKSIAYIGDAGSDVVAAKSAGCLSIGVLTGFTQGDAREKKEKMLKDLGCDVILDSILELPELLGV